MNHQDCTTDSLLARPPDSNQTTEPLSLPDSRSHVESLGSQRELSPNQTLILEESQTFCLRQDPLTQTYGLYDLKTQSSLLTTIHWAEAYRAWLNLHQQQVYPACLQQDSRAVTELHDCVNHHQEGTDFGHLWYSRDRVFAGMLQYCVQLSADTALRWAPSTAQSSSPGQFVIERLSHRRHRPAKWIESLSQSTIAEALHRSIHIFHQCWQYDLYRFNSEHWARLIVTGQCCSFQTEELYHHWNQTCQSLDSSQAQDAPDIWETNLEAEMAIKPSLAP